MATYAYEPLPPVSPVGRSPPYTRILHLSPSTSANSPNINADTEPFQGSLEIANIEAAAPYEALSYTWGTDDPQTYIWLLSNDGVSLPLPIKPNLAIALRFLRPPAGYPPRRLWIDALCIDQSSHEERSRQVQYMRLVYKHSWRVVAWLGSKTDTENTDLAFKTARRLVEVGRLVADIRSASNSTSGPAGGSGSGSKVLDNGFLADVTANALSGLPDDSMRCLSSLCWREYFQRTWVVQEITVSKMAIAKCEELEMPFFDLISTLMFVFQRRHGLPIEVPAAPSLKVWYLIFARQFGPLRSWITDMAGSLGPLIELLEFMREFKATDPRDKIYSVLGICDEGLQPILTKTRLARGMLTYVTTVIQDFVNSHNLSLDLDRVWAIPAALRPNYSRPVPEVYTDLAQFMITLPPMQLDVLSYVQHRSPPKLDDPYPSWVPKWFEPKTMAVFRGIGFSAGVYRPQLSDALQAAARVERAFSVPGALILEGFHVGTVHRVSEPMAPVGDDHSVTEVVLKAWRELLPHLTMARPRPVQHSYVFTGEPLDVAFCKALAVHPMGIVYGEAMAGFASVFQFSGVPDWVTGWDVDHHVAAVRKSDSAVGAFIDGLSGDGSVTLDAERSRADFRNTVRAQCGNRRAFLTHEGHFGIGPLLMREGDEVVVLFRGKMPYVLRRAGERHHVFVGNCYLRDDNIMHGRVIESVKHGMGGPPILLYEIR